MMGVNVDFVDCIGTVLFVVVWVGVGGGEEDAG